MALELSVVGAVDNLTAHLTDHTYVDANRQPNKVGLDLNETITLGIYTDTSGLTSTTVTGSGDGELLNFDLGGINGNENSVVLTPGGLLHGPGPAGLGNSLEALPGLGGILDATIPPFLQEPQMVDIPKIDVMTPFPRQLPFADNTVVNVGPLGTIINSTNNYNP